jgi:hypothetical protein
VWAEERPKLEVLEGSAFEVLEEVAVEGGILHRVVAPPGLICVAIGDIEGDNQMLRFILDFIESHKTVSFVFLGDLVDDISDLARNRDSQMKCLFDLEQYFEPAPGNVRHFQNLSFQAGDLNDRSRVRFIAGNSENDILQDLRQTASPGERPGTLVFGSGKWQKTLTEEELSVIYRYLACCNSELVSSQDGGVVHFRHAARARWTGEKKAEGVGKPDAKNPVVCGHNKAIGVGSFSGDQNDVVMLDTSLRESDIRLGAIGWEDGRLAVSLISLGFPKLSAETIANLNSDRRQMKSD